MQFNGVVNRLLHEDTEGRKRQLKLRTFSVICLNEECGVLEWVNDTCGLRPLVMKAHAFWPEVYPPPDFAAIRKAFEPVQNKFATDLPRLAHWYSQEILSKNKPCFHRWCVSCREMPLNSQWFVNAMLFSIFYLFKVSGSFSRPIAVAGCQEYVYAQLRGLGRRRPHCWSG